MIERFEALDAHDPRLAAGATGVLAQFNTAGVLTAADVHVAARTCALAGETDDAVALAVALAVRAVRHGSVCVDLAELVADDPDLPWPAGLDLDRVAASPLATASVVRVEGHLLYLDRYWREEGQVRDDLAARAAAAPPVVDAAALEAGAARLFPAGFEEQRAAAVAAAGQATTVLTGGPGTGKTTAVAGLLALLAADAERDGRRLRVALTAPTGKAAARLQQSVEEAQRADRFTDADRAALAGLTASTLHRLLGWVPDSRTRFKHHRGNRLPHDVVVVDETSMVSLTMMARLLEAVRPDARLVLVGDPDQLASVEAGAVLADLVAGLADHAPGAVQALRTGHRFGARIGALATALRDGDADTVLGLLAAGGDDVRLLDPDDAGDAALLRAELRDHALAIHTAASRGEVEAALAAVDRHRLLCAHRDGPYGVTHWNLEVERLLADALGRGIGRAGGGEWYAGRPLLVTANDYGLGLFNGDTGVTVAGDQLSAVIAGVGSHSRFAPSRLSDVETMHAMTVHKSQGSQADEVTVVLPPEDSPLLTRELLYTAVTRAQSRLTILGRPDAVRVAVERRALRASGLRARFSG